LPIPEARPSEINFAANLDAQSDQFAGEPSRSLNPESGRIFFFAILLGHRDELGK